MRDFSKLNTLLKTQPIFLKHCKGSHEATQQKILSKVSKILAEDNKVFNFLNCLIHALPEFN